MRDRVIPFEMFAEGHAPVILRGLMRTLLVVGLSVLLAVVAYLRYGALNRPAAPVLTGGVERPAPSQERADTAFLTGVSEDSGAPSRSQVVTDAQLHTDALAPRRIEEHEGLSLTGEVVGYSGYRLPQFAVQASPETHTDGAMTMSALTDDAGQFRFDDLPPYEYRVHHVFHSRADERELPLIRPPVRGLTVLVERPTLMIRPVGTGDEPVSPEALAVIWGGTEEPSPFSSEGLPHATVRRLSDGRTLAILEKPGPWKVLAFLPSTDGELRAIEQLSVIKEHRELTLRLDVTETRSVTIEVVDVKGVPVEGWVAEAWNSDLSLPIEESPIGSHQLSLPLGSWSVRLKPTQDGFLNAFDAEIKVGPNDPNVRTERVQARGLWGRLAGAFNGSPSTYHLRAVHESGASYGFTHRPSVDGGKWSSSLLRPGHYVISIRCVPTNAAGESQLEINAEVRPGTITSLDFSPEAFR